MLTCNICGGPEHSREETCHEAAGRLLSHLQQAEPIDWRARCLAAEMGLRGGLQAWSDMRLQCDAAEARVAELEASRAEHCAAVDAYAERALRAERDLATIHEIGWSAICQRDKWMTLFDIAFNDGEDEYRLVREAEGRETVLMVRVCALEEALRNIVVYWESIHTPPFRLLHRAREALGETWEKNRSKNER